MGRYCDLFITNSLRVNQAFYFVNSPHSKAIELVFSVQTQAFDEIRKLNKETETFSGRVSHSPGPYTSHLYLRYETNQLETTIPAPPSPVRRLFVHVFRYPECSVHCCSRAIILIIIIVVRALFSVEIELKRSKKAPGIKGEFSLFQKNQFRVLPFPRTEIPWNVITGNGHGFSCTDPNLTLDNALGERDGIFIILQEFSTTCTSYFFCYMK